MTQTAPQTAAIVLAAGASSRLGEPKQLVQLLGEPLLARTTRAALAAGVSHVWVVLSPELAETGGSLLGGMAATPVQNARAAEGMGCSLRVGMEAVLASDEPPGRVLLLVCDQPLVTAEHLRLLLSTPAPRGIAAAEYEGRVGVPAVFDRRHYAALMQVPGDAGARALLRSLPVTCVALPEAAVDIDTQEQLEAVRRRLARES